VWHPETSVAPDAPVGYTGEIRSSMPLAPASRLGPYEILSLISAGGMGEVYRARDTRLGREVAVKVLPADLARDGERLQRFQQEAQAASALNHPNVVAVHDVGTHDEVFFVVSELIDGETLRERLNGGPLPMRKAVDLAAQIARGLSAAHDKGVVHRDLKPENVMITRDERAKIVDFGLAKIDPPLASLGDPTKMPTAGAHTLPGALLGTVAYMSPEQIRSEAVDHRTDVFSFGTMLYEMLAGTRPFGGATAAETFSAILRDDPPPLPDVPPDIEGVVRHCLEKAREDRFQSARDLAFALESTARQLSAPRPIPSAGDATERAAGRDRSIAVLPFANVSPDPDSEYFSDGLTEELIHELTRVQGLKVVAWNSAAQLRGREHDIQAIGEQLNVHAVLVGSVRKAGERVRIAARLVETAKGYYLWSETYDRQIQDLFAIQEEIARAIAQTLIRTLADRRAPAVVSRQPGNLEAYTLYLKGRYFWNSRTPEGLRKGVECFEQAIAADEGSALAHAGLADAYCLLADYGLMHPREAMPRARSAALKALDLDSRSAEAHASYALIRSLYDREWEEAEAFYRRALELNPSYATAHHWFAVDYLGMQGRFDEAGREIEAARQLDPLSMIILEGRPYLLMLAHRYDEAIDDCRELARLDPTYYKFFTAMGRAYTQKGDYAEAVALLQKGRAMAGDLPNILGALGQTHALAGQRAEARQFLEELSRQSARKYVPSTSFALIHAGLGENDQALDWLEKGAEQRELPLSTLKVHPAYDSLRGEPRFTALLRQMRFEP
jgi:serine/threonine protein kinase/tetratricopeptide (TPR) repeat protein